MIKEDLFFKVVDKKTRFGSSAAMLDECVEFYLEQYPELFPKYDKGSIIVKTPNSIGILVFLLQSDAILFFKQHFNVRNAEIIKVQGYCANPVDKLIRWDTFDEVARFYTRPEISKRYAPAPLGTYGCDVVEVLE